MDESILTCQNVIIFQYGLNCGKHLTCSHCLMLSAPETPLHPFITHDRCPEDPCKNHPGMTFEDLCSPRKTWRQMCFPLISQSNVSFNVKCVHKHLSITPWQRPVCSPWLFLAAAHVEVHTATHPPQWAAAACYNGLLLT